MLYRAPVRDVMSWRMGMDGDVIRCNFMEWDISLYYIIYIYTHSIRKLFKFKLLYDFTFK